MNAGLIGVYDLEGPPLSQVDDMAPLLGLRSSPHPKYLSREHLETGEFKEGKPEQVHGNSIEMPRREGDKWKISFQAYARTACP